MLNIALMKYQLQVMFILLTKLHYSHSGIDWRTLGNIVIKQVKKWLWFVLLPINHHVKNIENNFLGLVGGLGVNVHCCPDKMQIYILKVKML